MGAGDSSQALRTTRASSAMGRWKATAPLPGSHLRKGVVREDPKVAAYGIAHSDSGLVAQDEAETGQRADDGQAERRQGEEDHLAPGQRVTDGGPGTDRERGQPGCDTLRSGVRVQGGIQL